MRQLSFNARLVAHFLCTTVQRGVGLSRSRRSYFQAARPALQRLGQDYLLCRLSVQSCLLCADAFYNLTGFAPATTAVAVTR